MRGRGRHIAGILAGTLAGRPEARLVAAGAAFAEAVGWPLSREVRLRALTRDGRVLAVARSERWAEQVRALAPAIVDRMNARFGSGAARAVEVRVGPLERQGP